ncbi:TULIP family P47-like protein [Bacillus sp. SCS-151]|uniref:TULIP family P47-like protein n=1 Tax=Nanhaiella sioensis TaxID=3115293 RepID=UPI00397B459F
MIDLFGWDTAYAISFYDANKAIKELDTTPPTFNYNTLDATGNITSSITGDWGHWSISTKSDGQNLVLRCPIKAGEFTTPLEPLPINMNESWVEVEVQLAFIESEENSLIDSRSIEGTGNQVNLQLQKDRIVITSSSFNFESSTDPSLIKVLCETVFAKYFEDHIDEFNHVFSTFIINQQSTNENFQWLKPTYVHYALTSVNDSENEEINLRNSTLGVMCMTEGREPPISGHMIDPYMLEYSQSTSAFAISGPLFVEKWLLPSVEYLFEETNIDDFGIRDDGLTIYNINEITWDTFKDNQKAIIGPENFLMTIDGDEIKVEFVDMECKSIDSSEPIHIQYNDSYNLSISNGIDNSGYFYRNSLQLNPLHLNPNPKIFVPSTIDYKTILRDAAIATVVTLLSIAAGEAFESYALNELKKPGNEIVDQSIEEGEEFVSLDTGNVLNQFLSNDNEVEPLESTKILFEHTNGQTYTLDVIGKDEEGKLLLGAEPAKAAQGNWWLNEETGELTQDPFYSDLDDNELKYFSVKNSESIEQITKLNKLKSTTLTLEVVQKDGEKIPIKYISEYGTVYNEYDNEIGTIDLEGNFKSTRENLVSNSIYLGKNNVKVDFTNGIDLYTNRPTARLGSGFYGILGVVRNEDNIIEEVVARTTNDEIVSITENDALSELINGELNIDDVPEIIKSEKLGLKRGLINKPDGSTSEIYGITKNGDVIGRVGNYAGTIDENLKFVPDPIEQRYVANSLKITKEFRKEILEFLYDNVTLTAEDLEEAAETAEVVSPLTEEQKPDSLLQSAVQKFMSNKQKIYFGLTAMNIGVVLAKDVVFPYIQEMNTKGEYSKLPSLDEFGQNCLSSVKWPNSGGFELKTASLHSCLLLGGDLLPNDEGDTL